MHTDIWSLPSAGGIILQAVVVDGNGGHVSR